MTEAPGYLLVGAALFFTLSWAIAALWPTPAKKQRLEKKRAHSLAVTAGSDDKRPAAERAASLVEAGRIALELKNVRLAARHAEWAHKLAPKSDEVLRLVRDSFVRAKRLKALERLLWVSVDEQNGPGTALDALLELYEGPLARPERARALRRLRGGPAGP